MMKKLNIELNVRRMEAQSILTSSPVYGAELPSDGGTNEGGIHTGDAPARAVTPIDGRFRN